MARIADYRWQGRIDHTNACDGERWTAEELAESFDYDCDPAEFSSEDERLACRDAWVSAWLAAHARCVES